MKRRDVMLWVVLLAVCTLTAFSWGFRYGYSRGWRAWNVNFEYHLK